MKALKPLYALLLLSLMLGATACNNTDDGSYVAPITLGEKIHGQWILNSIQQVDEATGKSIDLSGKFTFMTFGINLQADENNVPTSFTVEGTAPALLPTSGSWAMGNEFTNADGTPSTILLNPGDNAVVLTVTAAPGTNRTLSFKMTRKTKGLPFVSYVYNLVPIAVTE